MIEITIERCDKCGKTFLSKSEVKRHAMYEHIVPVSPFEDRLPELYKNTNPEDLHNLTTNTNDINDIDNFNKIKRVSYKGATPYNRKSALF